MTDFTVAQRRLQAAGYAIGAIDGVAGPNTWAGIMAYVAQRSMGLMVALGAGAAKHLGPAGIADSPARIANFIGQAAHESGGFRYLHELWGPTPAQAHYEGRADLGNNQPGDGFRYRGRGIFQITGRANYRTIGHAIGVDLEGNPDLAEQPDIAVQTAVYFWTSHGLSTLADAGQEDAITHRINGGEMGITDRRQIVARAKGLFI